MASLFILFLNLGGGEVSCCFISDFTTFGGKGVPNIARALGKGIREFKDAANGIQKDIQQNTTGFSNTIQEHIQEVKKEVDSLTDSKK